MKISLVVCSVSDRKVVLAGLRYQTVKPADTPAERKPEGLKSFMGSKLDRKNVSTRFQAVPGTLEYLVGGAKKYGKPLKICPLFLLVPRFLHHHFLADRINFVQASEKGLCLCKSSFSCPIRSRFLPHSFQANEGLEKQVILTCIVISDLSFN